MQGEIDRMSRLPDVFENEKTYRNTFKESYLRSDARQILLAYKIQFRLNRIVQEIIEKGYNKYSYIGRARNLLWALLIQALLNDPNLPSLCEQYGTRFVMEADLNEHLKDIASRRIRLIISEAVKDDRYQQMISDEKYSFLRTKATYQRCMDVAYKKYRWIKSSF